MKVLPNATLYEFGILTSSVHMAFMRYVAGRLKSDYRYSIGVVYNNFPFPEKVDKKEKQETKKEFVFPKVDKKGIEKIENLANEILETRQKFPDSSLADLYDKDSMPPELLKAHKNLDSAVDKLYNDSKIFKSDRERVQKIFAMHKELTKDLLSDEVDKKIKPRKRTTKKIAVKTETKKSSQETFNF
jgi:hypothetical protein